jgi:cation transport ATPase
MSIYTYSVPNMGGCCVDGVKQAFKDDELFGDCDVLASSHLTPTVTLNLGDEDAFKLLEDRDVHARVFKLLDDIGQPSTPLDVQAKPVGFSHTHKGALGLSSGFFLLFLPLFVTSMPLFVTALLASVSLGLTVALGWPFYRHAYRGLWKGNWTMDTLFSISTGVILLVSVAAFFVPGLPMMFEAGLLIFGFRHAGLAIEEAFKSKLVTSTRLQDDVPEFVMCQGQELSRDEVEPGHILQLFPGDILPVDGEFVSGAGFTSNKYKQGSERLTALVCNKKLDAGTKLMSVSDGESLLFKVHASVRDSFLAQEDARILEAKFKRARANPSPKPNTTAYMLQFFIPAVIAVAVISGLVVGVYFASWVLALQCASTVLVAACPCTFGLITPLVIQVGINKFKKKDVSFRIPEHLEAAAAVDCVVFDLNGTLTEGEPQVQAYHSYDFEYTNEKMLALMATLEADEPHPMAAAIRGKTTERVEGARQIVESEKPIIGGIHVALDGVEYRLGNYDMMQEAGIDLERPNIDLCKSVIYLESNQKVMGYVILEDKPREKAKRVIQALQSAGKKVCLCTGSDEKTAKDYAKKLGVDVQHTYSNSWPDRESGYDFKLISSLKGDLNNAKKGIVYLSERPKAYFVKEMNESVFLPKDMDLTNLEEKLKETKFKKQILDITTEAGHTRDNSKQGHVEALQKQGHTVAMVGDYANDASAIGASDFGLAIAHAGGHVAAQEAASAVIHDDSLLSVLQVFKTAERTVEHINQNLGFNLLYNAVAVFAPMGLLFGTGMMMSPAVGAALMMLQTVLIFANVYRFNLEEAPEIMAQPDLGLRHGNTDVPSISNCVGLTNTDRKRLYSEVVLDGADNTISDSLDEFERARFN